MDIRYAPAPPQSLKQKSLFCLPRQVIVLVVVLVLVLVLVLVIVVVLVRVLVRVVVLVLVLVLVIVVVLVLVHRQAICLLFFVFEHFSQKK